MCWTVGSFSTVTTVFQIYNGDFYSDEIFHLEFSDNKSIQGKQNQNNKDMCETIFNY